MLGSPNVLVFKPRHVWTWLLTQKNKEKNTAAHTSEVLAGVACRIDTVSCVLIQKEENKRRQTNYILKPQPTSKGLFLSVFSCSVLLREQDDNDDVEMEQCGCVCMCVWTFSLFHLDDLAADSMRTAMGFATIWIAGSPPSRLNKKHINNHQWRTDSDRVGAFLGVTSATSRGVTSATSRQSHVRNSPAVRFRFSFARLHASSVVRAPGPSSSMARTSNTAGTDVV